MSVITLLEKAQRINNAMPARMAQRPQVSETVIIKNRQLEQIL